MKKVIEVKNLTKEYKNLKAIDNLSFDVYEGEHVKEGMKSIAYNLLFMAKDRTLTDEEVMQVFNQIIDKVLSVHNAELRDK